MTKNNAEPVYHEYMTSAEVCELLRIVHKTLCRWKNTFPDFPKGLAVDGNHRWIRYKRSEIIEWVENQREA